MTTDSSGYAKRLPLWVVIGAVAGIAVGVFFGDRVEMLNPIGETYVRLMEIVVFPYIICSLLHGLGRLAPDTAWRLFRCGWHVFVLVWGSTFLLIFVLSFAIPEVPPANFIDASQPQQSLGLLEQLIPANPFLALVRNYVPAIVVFSVIYGIAIQRVDNKDSFLQILDLIRNASVTIWGWVVLLAPFGVFALFAKAAGTLDTTSLSDLSLYLIIMIAGTVLLAFWVLPSLMVALCPIRSRSVIRDLQNGLLIAVVTSLSVAALPFIQQAAEKMCDRHEIKDKNRGEIIKTTLAISYPLAQLGNFFIWLFILFSAYYYRIPLTEGKEIALPFITFLSGFGSPTTSVDSVDFLASWVRFPTEATELYVSMMTITRYGQVVASVMGFAFVTFLVTLSYYGMLKLRLSRLIWSLTITVGVLAVIVAGGRYIQDNLVGQETPSYLGYTLDSSLTAGVTVLNESESASSDEPGDSDQADSDQADSDQADSDQADGTTALSRIQKSGVMTVGYNSNIIPFSYRNSSGDLVGFDIAYVYRLAQDLNVKLKLVPFEWQKLADDLENNRFDLAVSGIYVNDDRLQRFSVTEPYMQSPVALIVKSDQVDNFLTRDSIRAQDNLVIGVFDDPILIPLARRLFPNAQVKVVSDYDELPKHPEIGAAIWTLEQAKAWTAHRNDYTAVVPDNVGSPFLIAYLLPANSSELTQFLNYWMRLQRASGFHDRMVHHWIEGKPDVSQESRWNILDDVLGWGDERR
ncbi:MAG: cation:dicarboxylase symporter family transporter [Pseudomonadota bacterium]